MSSIIGFFHDGINALLNFISLASHSILAFVINLVVYTMILLIIGLCGGKKTFDFVLRFLETIAGIFKTIFASTTVQQFFKWVFATIWNLILGTFKLIVLLLEKINWQFIFDKIEDFISAIAEKCRSIFASFKEKWFHR